jgi:transposase
MTIKVKTKRVTVRRRGRPTEYRPRYAAQAQIVCQELGATDKQLAKILGIGERTLNAWKKRYADFQQSIKRGKDLFDSEHVEKALLERAIGVEIKEVTTTQEDGKPVDRIVRKQLAGDVVAQIFWLKNRHAERWQDVRKIVGDGSLMTLPNITVNLVDEDEIANLGAKTDRPGDQAQ